MTWVDCFWAVSVPLKPGKKKYTTNKDKIKIRD